VERSIFFKPVQHCAGEKKRQVAKDSSAAHSLANRNLREKEREGITARELPEFFLSWVPRRAVGNDEIWLYLLVNAF
jgi:hypothetical protein